LSCYGGLSGECNRNKGEWSGNSVVCSPPALEKMKNMLNINTKEFLKRRFIFENKNTVKKMEILSEVLKENQKQPPEIWFKKIQEISDTKFDINGLKNDKFFKGYMQKMLPKTKDPIKFKKLLLKNLINKLKEVKEQYTLNNQYMKFKSSMNRWKESPEGQCLTIRLRTIKDMTTWIGYFFNGNNSIFNEKIYSACKNVSNKSAPYANGTC